MNALHRFSTSRASRQHGVVLVVALVMLIVIGFASVGVMRNVMSNDLVSENNRRQTQAMQAAQAALRYCEEEVTTKSLTPAAPADSEDKEDWYSFAKWKTEGTKAGGGRITVPADRLNGSTIRYKPDDTGPQKPQCMAQRRTVGGSEVVVVTARGFSDNYEVDEDDGETIAGSVVWLQSILQLSS